MSALEYSDIRELLADNKYSWLVTGAAGFIGSHLVEALLNANQQVYGLDNLISGNELTLKKALRFLDPAIVKNFNFIKGDVRDQKIIAQACQGRDFCLHQAALGSVPKSLNDPVGFHDNNVVGAASVFEACRLASVKHVTYASSSSVYGDNESTPKVEDNIGRALSPYALTKQINEQTADLYSRIYNLNISGLRYFNVFGPRQNPEGDYAAVIPRWINSLLSGERCTIYGDGSTSRDFCPVQNIVWSNIAAAISPDKGHVVFNVGLGSSTSLIDLYNKISKFVIELTPEDEKRLPSTELPLYLDFRKGDIKHSCADIPKITRTLGFNEKVTVEDCLRQTVKYFVEKAIS